MALRVAGQRADCWAGQWVPHSEWLLAMTWAAATADRWADRLAATTGPKRAALWAWNSADWTASQKAGLRAVSLAYHSADCLV